MLPNSIARQSGQVEQCVEILCAHGCGRVSEYIQALEDGRTFPEVAALSEVQRNEVLAELISIMAVYDGVCGR